MLSYLSAVGMKQYNTSEKIKDLINDVVSNSTGKYISNFKEDQIKIEYYKKLNEKVGLIVRGQMTDKEEMTIDLLLPYCLGEYMSNIVEVDVQNDQEGPIYYAICEEEDTATEIDFCLQNVVDYLDIGDDEEVFLNGVVLTGLSIEGKIILNVDKDDVEQELQEEEEEWRKDLVKLARQGDTNAIELLDIEAEEIDEVIKERLQEEDVFSVIEGLFMPYGDEQGIYSVLGTIMQIDTLTNKYTDEVVYNLHLESMGIKFEVSINKEDLTGEPSVGMRFLGICWMQGRVIFD